MDHYTHTLIGDERSALNRLPSIGPGSEKRQVAQATGTYDAAADTGAAPALARRRYKALSTANNGEDKRATARGGEGVKPPIKAGNCENLQSPATNTPCRARTCDPLIKSRDSEHFKATDHPGNCDVLKVRQGEPKVHKQGSNGH